MMLDKISPPNPNAEVQHVKTSVYEILQAPPFPPIPLIVITGGKPAMAWATAPAALAARAARAAHQKELACLSPRAKQIIAARSGHFPQFTEPGLVVAAVQEAVDAA